MSDNVMSSINIRQISHKQEWGGMKSRHNNSTVTSAQNAKNGSSCNIFRMLAQKDEKTIKT